MYAHVARSLQTRNIPRIFLRTLSSMACEAGNVVSVRSVANESHLTLNFEWNGKSRQLHREKSETLGKALKRLGISLTDKKAKKKKGNDATSTERVISVSLLKDDAAIEESVTNENSWTEGAILKIDEEELSVTVNPPSVKSLSLPSSLMSEFPVFPQAEFEFADNQNSSFTWYVQKLDESSENNSQENSQEQEEIEWSEVSKGCSYTPSVHDINKHLKVVCLPGNKSRAGVSSAQVISPNPVSAGPGTTPFDLRHLYTPRKLSDDKIRIVSYNILADMYAREDFAINVLYPYCPQYALDIGYRQHLVVKELLGYNADIICLQECGRKFYDNYLMPTLLGQEYQGCFKAKVGEVPEGEAIFFRSDRFKLLDFQSDIEISNSLRNDVCQRDLLQMVQANPTFLERVMKQATVAQIIFLQSLDRPHEILCVSNTHLYFKPNAPHVRLVQTGAMLNAVENACSLMSTKLKSLEGAGDSSGSPNCTGGRISRVFCGDFNSLPHSAVLHLMTSGHVSASHVEIAGVCEEEKCKELELKHDLQLTNVCGIPEFTTYTGGFKGTLDYIFVEKEAFEVEAVVPFPAEDELTTHVALPSVVMPSDHLALVGELKWRTVQKGP